MADTIKITADTRARRAIGRTTKAQRARHLERIHERDARDQIADATTTEIARKAA